MLELAHVYQYLVGQVQDSASEGPSGKPHEAEFCSFTYRHARHTSHPENNSEMQDHIE